MMLYKVRLPVPDGYGIQTRATHKGRVPLTGWDTALENEWREVFPCDGVCQFCTTMVPAALSCQPCWRPDLSQKGDR